MITSAGRGSAGGFFYSKFPQKRAPMFIKNSPRAIHGPVLWCAAPSLQKALTSYGFAITAHGLRLVEPRIESDQLAGLD